MTGVPASLNGRRVLLRRWRPEDDRPLAALTSDPEVMRYFPAMLSRRESDRLARRFDDGFSRDGFGAWAVGLPGIAPFIGFVGCWSVARALPFAADAERPVVEIGWRLARAHWRRGYALEAARVALSDLFGRCDVAAVVAYTAALNVPSRGVMERLGMRMSPAESFDHPSVAPGHPLAPHVLYRLAAADFTGPPHP